MDVLSDVLTTVRLQSEIHFCPELSAPWGIAFPAQSDRAVFYVLSRGSCYLEVEGLGPPIPLVGGDLFIGERVIAVETHADLSTSAGSAC